MENNNLENTQENEGLQNDRGQRMFTQDELDEIVRKRLDRDRKNRTGDSGMQEREKSLDERENNLYAREKFMEYGFSSDLMELVSGKSKEDIDKTIKILKPYIDKTKEPILNAVGPTSWGMRQNSNMRGDSIRNAMGLNRKG